MFPQTTLFIGLLFLDGIPGKDNAEVVDEEVEQMDGSAIGVIKMLGGFAIGGNGPMALLGKQTLKKGDEGLLKIAQGDFLRVFVRVWWHWAVDRT